MAFRLGDPETFSNRVEQLVSTKKILYMDAILFLLAEAGIDVDNTKIKSLLLPNIQKKLYEESIEYNVFAFRKRFKKKFVAKKRKRAIIKKKAATND